MTREQRIKRLEGPSAVDGNDVPLITMFGSQTPEEDRNSKTENFFCYCMDKNCPPREHLPLAGKSYEDAVAGLGDQHQGKVENDT